MNWIIIVFVLVFIGIVIYLFQSNKEYYGGPIKRIRRIPQNTCYNLCEQNYQYCMNQFGYINALYCSNKLQNCKHVCDYTDYQRL